MSNPIVIVCGPTASGKSARAIDIAQAANGVIINADAMQVYRELRILTARPSEAEQASVPHRLYGVLAASETCSAARWLTLACEAIDTARGQQRTAIVTGGTGLYIKALMEGLSPIPDIPVLARTEATTLWQEQGDSALKARDPHMYSRLKPGDRQRHIRALEVMIATGKSLAYWQGQPRRTPYPDASFRLEYITLPRPELYARCDARLLAMVQGGALDEVRALLALELSLDKPAMRAVGVRELAGHLQGKYTLNEAIRRAQQATRNYAKRQVTWFTHQLAATAP